MRLFKERHAEASLRMEKKRLHGQNVRNDDGGDDDRDDEDDGWVDRFQLA